MHEDCTPTHGYAAPREAAMAAFAKKLAVGISGAGKPSRQLGNGGLPRPRA
jgi:hypothetical protein